LLKQVSGYLKVDTDEGGSCRRFDNAGACKESDAVFSLGEQRLQGPHQACPIAAAGGLSGKNEGV
jgi:hypothetical protein